MRTSYEEKFAGKEWSTIRFCFRWNFQSAHAKANNAEFAINTGRHENEPFKNGNETDRARNTWLFNENNRKFHLL